MLAHKLERMIKFKNNHFAVKYIIMGCHNDWYKFDEKQDIYKVSNVSFHRFLVKVKGENGNLPMEKTDTEHFNCGQSLYHQLWNSLTSGVS